MLLLLLLLIKICVVSSGRAADIFPCDSRNGPLHFAEDSRFAVCCELAEKYCNNTTLNDTLTLLPQNENLCREPCAEMQRLNVCLVKFEVNNASSKYEGNYLCNVNSERYVTEKAYIIKKPLRPIIKFFSCTQNNNLTVIFDRGAPSTVYNDSYFVKMIESGKTLVLCSNTYMCGPNDQICTCSYPLNKAPVPVNTVTIIVSVSRSVQSSEARRNYSIAASILPGPMRRLKVKDVGPHDASVQFCMHEDTLRLYHFMSDAGAPLLYHLLVYKKQGVTEVLNVTLPPLVDKSFSMYKCMRVHLPELTAFTNYTVIVSGSGGGGEGKKIKLEFVTDQTVPAYPPLIDEFSFSRPDKVNVNGTMTSVLLLMWKPLPIDARGGTDFSYYIEVTSEDGFRVSTNVLEPYAVILHKDLPPGLLNAKVWAKNVVGHSKNYARLAVPPKSESAVPYVIVEFRGDKALVHVNLTSLKKDTQLAIHWCGSKTVKKVYGLIICQEYPRTAIYTIGATEHVEAQMFEINTSKTDENLDVTKDRTIEYYDLQYLNSVPRNAKTANATVTVHPNDETKAVEDYEFYDDDFRSDYDFLYYDENLRRSDISDSTLNLATEDDVRWGKLLQYQNPQTGDSSLQATTTIFISLKKEDNSGMVPANCYFNRTKDKVSLIVSYFMDKSDKKATLRWSQLCNTETPLQFMADYFSVYTSQDEHCKENQIFIGKTRNTIFQPNFMSLPQQTQFACIKSCKDDGVCASELSVTSLSYPEDADTPSHVIIGAVIPVVSVLAVLALVIKCRTRRAFFLKDMKQSMIRLPSKTASDVPVDEESRYAASEITGVTEVQSISTTSTDSGRGSGDLCDVDSKNDNKISDGSNIISNTISNMTHSSNADSRPRTENSEKERNTGSGDGEECDECDTDEESKGDSDRTDDSDPDLDQGRALDQLGISFINRNESSNSQYADSGETYSSSNESSTATDHNENLSHNTDHTRSCSHSSSCQLGSLSENIFQDHPNNTSHVLSDIALQRCLSSESESDGDSSERPLIS